jgi:ribonuclease BN (tRNA processing enzyme)
MSQMITSTEPAAPVANLRITLWGVQGSISVFPPPQSIEEYARRFGRHILTGTFEQMRRRGDRCTVEDLLGGPQTQQAVDDFQRRLGIPDLPLQGGETTCVQVETSEGNVIILDAGSGIRRCSLDLAQRWRNRKDRVIHLLGSHEHFDHRSGLAFSRFCYDDPPYTVHVLGPYAFLHALDVNYGIFSRDPSVPVHLDDPIDFSLMSARFEAVELSPGGKADDGRRRYWPVRDLASFRVGSTTITPFDVYHATSLCLGYRIEHNGKVFLFATDHERRHGDNPADERQKRSLEAEARVIEHSRNADLAYYDGQFFLAEYQGQQGVGGNLPAPRKDWGHSCVEDIVERTRAAGVKRVLIGHHDPDRDWTDRVEMDRHLARQCQGKPYRIQMAQAYSVFEL